MSTLDNKPVAGPAVDEDFCWQAMTQRQAAYDGSFVYAVTTTGVFCRPACRSRLPQRQNVRFYDSNEAALQAGYRACRRCHPLRVGRLDASQMTLIDIARQLQAKAHERLTLAQLAQWSGLSAGYLQRRFKAFFGVSPKAFQAQARLLQLKAGLRHAESITDAMHAAGYGSGSRLQEQADGRLGMTPSAYRQGGAGEILHYACRDTALGPLLMAATARGVCFVQFGPDEASLRAQLASEFPRAAIQESIAAQSPQLQQWMDALQQHLQGHAPHPKVPLDLRGTAFQIQVWRFLMQLREGSVISYSELAQGIGRPQAVRAAASACAANRIAVLVPCHRVLRGDGQLGGYRWGLARKRSLIDAERRSATDA